MLNDIKSGFGWGLGAICVLGPGYLIVSWIGSQSVDAIAFKTYVDAISGPGALIILCMTLCWCWRYTVKYACKDDVRVCPERDGICPHGND